MWGPQLPSAFPWRQPCWSTRAWVTGCGRPWDTPGQVGTAPHLVLSGTLSTCCWGPLPGRPRPATPAAVCGSPLCSRGGLSESACPRDSPPGTTLWGAGRWPGVPEGHVHLHLHPRPVPHLDQRWLRPWTRMPGLNVLGHLLVCRPGWGADPEDPQSVLLLGWGQHQMGRRVANTQQERGLNHSLFSLSIALGVTHTARCSPGRC